MKKRFLSLLLVFVMLASMAPVTALAQGAEETLPPAADAQETQSVPDAQDAQEEQSAREPQDTPDVTEPTDPADAPDAPDTSDTPDTPDAPDTPETPEGGDEPQDEEPPAEPETALTETAAPVADVPVAAAEAPVDLTKLRVSASFQEKNTSFPDSSIEKNMARVSMTGGPQWDPNRFKVSVQAPGSDAFVPVAETVTTGVTKSTGAWTLEHPKEGVYTVEVRPAEGVEDVTGVAQATFTLYKVTFHAKQTAGGAFADASETYTGYGIADSMLSSYNVPKVTPPDGEDFIGWCAEPDHKADDGQTILQLTAAARHENNYTADVYAAYGTKLYAKIEAGPVEITVKKGYIPANSGKAVTIRNTGNQDVAIQLRATPAHFDVVIEGGSLTISGKGEGIITVRPKADLGIGTYKESLLLWKKDSGSALAALELQLTVEPATVTVTPGTVTKEYGQTLNAGSLQNVQISLDNGGQMSYEELVAKGLRLDSTGFSASAPAGSYEINYNGPSELGGYKVVVQGGTVQVNQTTPEGTANAGGVRVGDTLEKAALTGSFINRYTHMTVDGVLSWEEPGSTVVSDTPGTVRKKWTFTPAESKNYATVTGTADIVVSDKEVTTLSAAGETSFIYDGQTHPLQVVSNRPEGEAGQVKVLYEPQGGEDSALTANAPKDVGTYVVHASIDESANYAAASYEFTLTIEKRTLTVLYSYGGKVYDGTPQVQEGGVALRPINLVSGDSVTVTYSGLFDDKNAGSQNVSITLEGLVGPAAGNYQLPENRTFHTTAIIAPAPVTVTLKEGITKEYGDILSFQPGQFTADGLVNGETEADLNAEFSSQGAAANATVAVYSVSAVLRNGNYRLTKADAGKIEVIPATPELRGLVLAGVGMKEGKLQDVTITGEFVNPHDSTMAVPGRFEWKEPDATLPNADSCQAEWVFRLGDTKNYKQPDGGTITVQLVDKMPVPLKADTQYADYTGQPQAFVNYEVGSVAGDASFRPENITVRQEYRVHEDFLHEGAGISLMSVGREWTDEKPQDVGTYDVRITAQAGIYANKYADNSVQAHLEILPAVPKTDAVPKQVTVKENAGMDAVAEQLKPKPADVDGNPLAGSYAWESPGLTVTRDGAQFRWYFIPQDSNYTSVSGEVTVLLAPDDRTIQGQIFNLPSSLGYEDYAVVDVEASELEEGETVVFFKVDANGAFTDPVSAPVTVTGEQLTVPLDGDALASTGGALQARITSSRKHAGTVLYCGQEPVAELLTDGLPCYGLIDVQADSATTVVSAAVNGEKPYEILSVTYSLSAGSDIGIAQDGKTATLTGGSLGQTAVLTAVVTVLHPDPAKSETLEFQLQTQVICQGFVTGHVVHSGVNADADRSVPLEEQVLGQAAIQQIQDKGLGIDVVLSVADKGPAGVPQPEQTMTETLCKAGGYTVGEYLDITLTAYVTDKTGREPMALDQSNTPIRITVELPQRLREALGEKLYSTEFAVVRIHEGKADLLRDLDGNAYTVTFSTDKFSTYALVHREAAERGGLTVSCKITGNQASKEQIFQYELTVSGLTPALEGSFAGLEFADGKASFDLKGGESLTVSDLPAGCQYTVTQKSNADYATSQTGDKGTVADGKTAEAVFTNKRDIHDITLDGNGGKMGGSGLTTAQTKPDGTLSSLPEPKKEGVYFAGWYTSRRGGTRVNVRTVYTADTTLYAHWSKVPLTGDVNNPALWAALLGVSALAICAGAVVLLRRKKKK